jgi:hypothetical protein
MEVLYTGKASTGNEDLQRIAEAVKEALLARQQLGAYTSFSWDVRHSAVLAVYPFLQRGRLACRIDGFQLGVPECSNVSIARVRGEAVHTPLTLHSLVSVVLIG